MAEAVSKLIGGEIHEIPSQSCNVESIEAVMRICAYVPQGGRGAFHVIIANEADRMSPAGQVKFLSILDRVPDQTIIFFTANDTACLEKRFLSRCRVLNFKAETVESELAAYLERIYKAEGGTFPVDFPKIARECENNVRAALGRLDVELLLGADRADLPEPKQADVQKNAIQTPAESRPETFYVRSARRRNRQAIKGLPEGRSSYLSSLREPSHRNPGNVPGTDVRRADPGGWKNRDQWRDVQHAGGCGCGYLSVSKRLAVLQV